MTEPKREEERPCAPCTSAAGGEIWHGPLGCPRAMAGASDPLVASLDEIRRNLRVFGASDDEAARLLAAVEAVLRQHRKRDEPVKTRHVCRVHADLHHPSPQWRADVDACPDCTVTGKWVCAEPSCRHECPDDDEWPCPTYRAITSALTASSTTGEKP